MKTALSKSTARKPRADSAVLVVLVTTPTLKVARRLARAALDARLIACANLVPSIESHYVWQGRVERSTEVLMVMKTTRQRLAALEAQLLAQHPYDTAEFLALPVTRGAAKYLAWVEAQTSDFRAADGQG